MLLYISQLQIKPITSRPDMVVLKQGSRKLYYYPFYKSVKEDALEFYTVIYKKNYEVGEELQVSTESQKSLFVFAHALLRARLNSFRWVWVSLYLISTEHAVSTQIKK